MSVQAKNRIKLALYVLTMVLAELVQTSVFGGLRLGVIPCVIPVAVACVSVFEGAENGGVFGLVGGCLWAWSTQMSYYGVWCILAMTLLGVLAGLVTERFLLRGLPTALCVSAAGLVLTDGLYTLARLIAGRLPAGALWSTLLPECLISLALCLVFYPLTAAIARIGGSHG